MDIFQKALEEATQSSRGIKLRLQSIENEMRENEKKRLKEEREREQMIMQKVNGKIEDIRVGIDEEKDRRDREIEMFKEKMVKMVEEVKERKNANEKECEGYGRREEEERK